MNPSHREQGQQAEANACRFLQDKGLSLIERNYHCRGGEIDLIMRDGKELVFVEVRMRRNPHFASAAESVDWYKQQRLVKAASHYLQVNNKQMSPCRFDVIGLDGSGDIAWIRNAFDLG